jgi:crossover junction endodeoxyribonuclease RusA
MSKIVTLKLPFPPSVNHSHHYANKRKFVSKKTKEFREAVQEAVIELGEKLYGRLAMFITLYPPDKRRRDIGNYEKQLTDAIMLAGLFLDDEQIDTITIVRRDIVKGGACRVVFVSDDAIDAKNSIWESL